MELVLAERGLGPAVHLPRPAASARLDRLEERFSKVTREQAVYKLRQAATRWLEKNKSNPNATGVREAIELAKAQHDFGVKGTCENCGCDECNDKGAAATAAASKLRDPLPVTDGGREA